VRHCVRDQTREEYGGFERAGSILQRTHSDLIVSKQKLRKMEGIELIRLRGDQEQHPLAFTSRPFVLCGLPLRRPPSGTLLYERRNGHFKLQIIGHPEFGVPYGQDRLIPIFLATLAVRQQTEFGIRRVRTRKTSSSYLTNSSLR
jgi:hypothetical protein